MNLKYNMYFLLVAVLVFIIPAKFGFSSITREGDRIYITDLTGEKWEITQAVSLGFKPEGFNHGIGKHALDRKSTRLNSSHYS